MKLPLSLYSAAAACTFLSLVAEAPLSARSADFAVPSGQELPAYLQCVPYAREVSGIRIFGDAHTWWQQAAGRYERGNVPKVGAVMAFKPSGNMQLGHVAAVSKIIDSRTVLLDHANWSPINGRRGQIERNVKAIDVSRDNDWSEVRVWYHPLQALGKTAWPVHGFIYSTTSINREAFQRDASPQAPVRVAVAKKPSRDFLKVFSGLGEQRSVAVTHSAPQQVVAASHHRYRKAPPLAPRNAKPRNPSPGSSDPFSAILSRYDPAR